MMSFPSRCNTIKCFHGTRLVTAIELLITLNANQLQCNSCTYGISLLTLYTANIARTGTNQCKFLYIDRNVLETTKNLNIHRFDNV